MVLPYSFVTGQGQQLEYILLEAHPALFEPAVETYLQHLQAERDAEAAAAPQPLQAGDDAQQDASTNDDDAWERDPTLLRRMAAVREAERSDIVAEILYLLCMQRLREAGLQLEHDLSSLTPEATKFSPPAGVLGAAAALQAEMARLRRLLSAPVADAIAGYVGSTLQGADLGGGSGGLGSTGSLMIDRLQAARLYAGMVEFGYFCGALEDEFLSGSRPGSGGDSGGDDAGRVGSNDAASTSGGGGGDRATAAAGDDAGPLVEYAALLPDERLRSMCRVASADGWRAAVAHTGGLFGLTRGDSAFNCFGLPFQQLDSTLSSLQAQPTASVWEHYSPPGSQEERRRRARDRAARGWGRGDDDAGDGGGDSGGTGGLPEADLLLLGGAGLRRLLLDGALLGALMWGSERRVEGEYGYRLCGRAEREAYAAAEHQE